MLMQVDITERAKVEATLAKLTESQVSKDSRPCSHITERNLASCPRPV